MKFLLLLGILIVASDLRAQIEQPVEESTRVHVSLDAGLGPGYDADLLSLYRVNLGDGDHRLTLALYCQGEGLDLIDLKWNFGTSGAFIDSEPIPDRTSMSDPTELVLSYGPVLRTGRISISPSFGIGIGWRTETQYYNGRRDHYSGGLFGFGWSADVYDERYIIHNHLVAPLGVNAEIRLLDFLAITAHAFVNTTGPVKHGWAIGLGGGRY